MDGNSSEFSPSSWLGKGKVMETETPMGHSDPELTQLLSTVGNCLPEHFKSSLQGLMLLPSPEP
jgi:hypothetical protein